MTKIILYDIICAYCLQPYDFRYYEDNKYVVKPGKPKLEEITKVETQGICDKCTDTQYKILGIETKLTR